MEKPNQLNEGGGGKKEFSCKKFWQLEKVFDLLLDSPSNLQMRKRFRHPLSRRKVYFKKLLKIKNKKQKKTWKPPAEHIEGAIRV